LNLPRLEVQRDRLDAIELKTVRERHRARCGFDHDRSHRSPVARRLGRSGNGVARGADHLLRDQLHFKNLIVTDAMTMPGLAMLFDSGEGSVRSLIAGADVLLMPPIPIKRSARSWRPWKMGGSHGSGSTRAC
jgi:hypothetical protein